MSTDISALYREFTDALTEVLAENAVGPARRGRLARARAAVKKHPQYSEHAYFLPVETAFHPVGSFAKRRSLGPGPPLSVPQSEAFFISRPINGLFVYSRGLPHGSLYS